MCSYSWGFFLNNQILYVLVFGEHADGGDAEQTDCSGFEPDSEHLLTGMVCDTARSLTRRTEIIHLKSYAILFTCSYLSRCD